MEDVKSNRILWLRFNRGHPGPTDKPEGYRTHEPATWYKWRGIVRDAGRYYEFQPGPADDPEAPPWKWAGATMARVKFPTEEMRVGYDELEKRNQVTEGPDELPVTEELSKELGAVPTRGPLGEEGEG